MRWEDQRRSDNVDDQRGSGGGFGGGFGRGGFGGGFGGGRGFPIPIGRGGGKMGIGMVLVVLALMWFGGGDLGSILGPLTGEQFEPPPQTQTQRRDGQPPAQGQTRPQTRGDAADFVRVVLASTEDSWKDIFSQLGRQYEEPRLVLFRDAVQSDCGGASTASGPFYCPLDRRIYIDLSFFDELGARFGAPGDFAQAYVIAHEVGHHVQTLLGISQKVQSARRGADETTGNALSVKLELQADCFAGVWAAHSERQRQWLDQGDVKEGLDAAAAIGDDRLQRRMQGRVVPESFTHGSSAQRVRWFQRGMAAGDLRQCDTFNAQTL